MQLNSVNLLRLEHEKSEYPAQCAQLTCATNKIILGIENRRKSKSHCWDTARIHDQFSISHYPDASNWVSPGNFLTFPSPALTE